MKSVLFVDDNQMLCRLSCDILRMQGYHAVPAYNAADALSAFSREPFDIVVTDFAMGEMDGLQLARAIHELAPGTPIILVTAYDVQQRGDFVASLSKQDMFPGLIETIESCVAQGQD